MTTWHVRNPSDSQLVTLTELVRSSRELGIEITVTADVDPDAVRELWLTIRAAGEQVRAIHEAAERYGIRLEGPR